ncbi:MAG: AAA family ATPase, partial [Candidatus Dormibacteraeota bacterium]|nr:AAA family ATPase [Candidatus Dormibacteraeota bacterium]
MSVIPLRGTDEAPDSVRERAIRLFQFLCEYTLLRTRSVRTTDSYEEVIWLADVPETPGCRCAVPDADGRDPEIWMEIAQPRLEQPPEPPDLLIPWLRPGSVLDSGPEAPVLLDAIPVADEEQEQEGEEAEEEPEEMRLEEHPQVRWAYDQYLDRWRPWAEKDRVLRRQQRVYTDLFRLHQAQRRLGEAYEVVMGLGHLSWRTPSGAAVRRHLVVAQTDVRFDADAGVITVVAAVDGARPELEQDMLEPNERPGADEVERIGTALSEVGDDIFGDPEVRRILRAWVHGASSRGRFENELAPQESVSDQPLVRLAPALILRRRNERSILQALEAIVEQLQEGSADLPEGVRQLVQIVEEGDPEEEAADASQSEVLLPLPANEEQLDIVRRLRSRPGVLVQGPPGTGKSHTIANLVAHLLAQGQRVLVTSHTARALEVLRDKVPKEIRELAVVVLGNDVSGRDELRASVAGIQHRYSSWNPRRSEERVSSLRDALDDARAAEAEAVGRLSTLREADSHHHPPRFGDYEGTTQEIATQLRRRAADHGWIVAGDDLSSNCPLSPEEASELRELARDLDAAAEEELALAVPDPATLPSPEALAGMVEGEREAAAASAEVERYRRHPGYAPLRSSPAEARTAFWSAAHELAASRRALERRPEPWLSKAADEVLLGYSGRWHELERFTAETLDAVQRGLPEVAHAQVTGVGGRPVPDLLADARPLVEHLRQGQGWGRGPFQAPVVKRARYLADQVRVDGLSCRDLGVLERLVRWLEVQAALDRLDAEWSSIAEVSAGSPSARAARYSDLQSALRAVLLVERRLSAIDSAAAAVPNLRSQDWQDTDA